MFVDGDYPKSGRDALYYARVFEPPIEAVNGSPLNCTRDAQGRCIESNACDVLDECLAADEPRAWSSPIWYNPGAS